MINTSDSPLEQGPNILNPVSMDIPGLHIGFRMIDRIMDKFRAIKPQVGLELIGMNFGPRMHMVADKSQMFLVA